MQQTITPEELKEAVVIAKRRFNNENSVISSNNIIAGTKPALRPVYDKNGQRLGRVCYNAYIHTATSRNCLTLDMLRNHIWV